MGLQHPCHKHALILRILSHNSYQECRLCRLEIHGPTYCCDDCDYFLHGSCALIELPSEVRHPSHPRHLLTLSGGRGQNYSCKKCRYVELHVLTAIATLPPPGHEESIEHEEEEEEWEEGELKEEEEEEGEGEEEEEEEERRVAREEDTDGDDYVYDGDDGKEDEKDDDDDDDDDEDDDEDEDEDDDDDDDEEEEDDEEEDEEEDLVVVVVEEEGEGMIRHSAHKKHPLASFSVGRLLVQPKCEGCQRRISGQVYGCRACLFLLHSSCARSPQVIDHPFGSKFTLCQYDSSLSNTDDQCRACKDYFDRDMLVYSRPDGMGDSITLHMACALATRFPPGDEFTSSTNFKVHPSHPCPLVLFCIEKETYAPICCAICELEISGDVFGCPKCGFFLHKSCTDKLPKEIHHYLHTDHPLKLVHSPKLVKKKTQSDRDYHCASCQDSVFENDVYMAFQCHSCKFYLHPSCALPALSSVEDGAAASVSHFTHDHPLQLHFIRDKEIIQLNDYCIACKEPTLGLSYCCVTCDNVRLHKSCAELPQELEHAFHSQHLLVLLPKAPAGYFHCSVCSKKSKGFAYYCAKCEFYLDVGCATLNLTLKHPRHEHQLAYFTESASNQHRPCNACGKRCNKDLYRCVPCDFRLHYDCLPLPPKIKHEGHRLHPVFLQDKFVDGDPNYQYCDHCEKLRHPEQGVYRCEECWFAAHIDCMISKGKFQVEFEVKETEVEAEGTEVEPQEMETSKQPVADQSNSEDAHLEAAIDLLRKNIGQMSGSLEALMKKLEELELKRERERDSMNSS